MTKTRRYRDHRVESEHREDGTVLLRSGHTMSEPVATSAHWLRRWARERPDQVFLAERSGAGWYEVSYAETLDQVRALAGSLLGLGLGKGSPILILSGNSIRHGLLSLAAHYIGAPTVPVAEQYSLIPGAQAQLRQVVDLVTPALVFAEDGARFGHALDMPEMADLRKLVGKNADASHLMFDSLLRGEGAVAEAAAAQVGPGDVVKILMTSGSTSAPKGVPTTHAMMCTNQAQLLDALPFLADRPPRIVDWLPWNHVFGGSHNFNMMLANGGSLYIDGGKPAKGLVDLTIENNAMIGATLAFNVPVGFAMLRDAMRADAALRQTYFRDLDMLFYAGASLPQDVWRDLSDMAREVRGSVPLMTSSWGMTETSPAALLQHEPTDRSGIVGVPVSGVTAKLIPEDEERYELRVAGPSIMSGYYNNPAKTAEAFDEEGFFRTGDAVAFVDPDDMRKGLRFAGRMSEDFKLTTGIWVRATQLRLDALVALGGLGADVVVTGEGRDQVGLLILPGPEIQAARDLSEDRGVLLAPSLRDALVQRLQTLSEKAAGSSQQVRRALILAEPPSMAAGEVTAKGNLNFGRLLTRRARLLERLYSEADAAVLRLDAP